jgi:hypothetical protein
LISVIVMFVCYKRCLLNSLPCHRSDGLEWFHSMWVGRRMMEWWNEYSSF